MKLIFGSHTKSHIVRRYFVKLIWPSPPARIVDTRTYVHGKRVKLTKGANGYMLDMNLKHKWGINILVYHDGIDIDGIRLEIYLPGTSKY